MNNERRSDLNGLRTHVQRCADSRKRLRCVRAASHTCTAGLFCTEEVANSRGHASSSRGQQQKSQRTSERSQERVPGTDLNTRPSPRSPNLTVLERARKAFPGLMSAIMGGENERSSFHLWLCANKGKKRAETSVHDAAGVHHTQAFGDLHEVQPTRRVSVENTQSHTSTLAQGHTSQEQNLTTVHQLTRRPARVVEHSHFVLAETEANKHG